MVKIKAFRGIRPDKELASKIAALPYDVMNSEEARALAADDPYSFLHVSKAEIDLPPELDPYDLKVYLKARENLESMIARGWLFQDQTEMLYVYRQIMDAHTQFGLVTTANVNDYFEGRIKIHELTREAKERDRMNHVDYTNANTGPVFLTYPAKPVIDTIIRKIVTENPPEYDFTAADGVQHTLWLISDRETIIKLTNHFGQIPHCYVADGHHRAKSAALVGKARRASNPHHTGNEEYNWFLAAFFPHDQLRIMDYNRVVKDLKGSSVSEFIKRISEKFEINPVGCAACAKPSRPNHFAMYLDHKWYTLIAKSGTFDIADLVASLDISILQNNLLTPLLGIGDPRKDERIDFVGGIRGLGELEKRVDSGEMAVTFALYPTSIEQLMAIADAGQIMPPKSTWFEPKLRSGLVIHSLE